MNSVLDYFISLQESQSADMNEQSVEMWNRRAEFWENARKKNQKGNERVVSAINYLEQKGLLDKNYDVAAYAKDTFPSAYPPGGSFRLRSVLQ